MRIFTRQNLTLLLVAWVVYLLNVSLGQEEADAGGDVKPTRKRRDTLGVAQSAISDAAEVLETITNVAENFKDLGKNFMKLSKALSALGPVFMAISAITSIATIFLPEEESPIVAALKTGFDKVNNKIDVIQDMIVELKVVIEISQAKSTITRSIDAINGMYEELGVAQRHKSRVAWDYFINKFDHSYGHSAATLYNSMIGPGDRGDFQFDLLDLFKKKFRCHTSSIAKVCLISMQMINKGLAVEAAYLGAVKYPSRVRLERAIWERRLLKLRKRCGEIIENCNENYFQWADQVASEYYNAHVNGQECPEFSKNLAHVMRDAFSVRDWFAFCTEAADVSPFGFGYKLELPHVMEWINKNGKNVLLISLAQDRAACDVQVLKDSYTELAEVLPKIVQCTRETPGPLWYSSTNAIQAHFRSKTPQALSFGGPTRLEVSMGGAFRDNSRAWLQADFKSAFCLSEDHRLFFYC